MWTCTCKIDATGVKQSVEFRVRTWLRASLCFSLVCFSLRRLPSLQKLSDEAESKSMWKSSVYFGLLDHVCRASCSWLCFVLWLDIHTHERRALFNTAPESAEQNKLNFGRWHKFVAKLSPTLNLFGFEREVLGGTGPLVWTQYLH